MKYAAMAAWTGDDDITAHWAGMHDTVEQATKAGWNKVLQATQDAREMYGGGCTDEEWTEACQNGDWRVFISVAED